MCACAGRRAIALSALAPDRAILIPHDQPRLQPAPHGLPGCDHDRLRYVHPLQLDVCRSLVAHGFRRILIVNGHGSNTPFVDIIARLTVVETGALAAAINYWNAPGVHEVAESLRESDKIGGMNHACEFETSIYLALRPDLVDMSKAVREIGHHPTKNYWTDLVGGDGPLAMMEHWSALSQSGVMGDPTKATAEKGEKLLNAAAAGLVEIIDELRARRPAHRVDHH